MRLAGLQRGRAGHGRLLGRRSGILLHNQLEVRAIPDNRHGNAGSRLESAGRAHIDRLAHSRQARHTVLKQSDHARFDNLTVPREIAKLQTAVLQLRNR